MGFEGQYFEDDLPSGYTSRRRSWHVSRSLDSLESSTQQKPKLESQYLGANDLPAGLTDTSLRATPVSKLSIASSTHLNSRRNSKQVPKLEKFLTLSRVANANVDCSKSSHTLERR